MLLPDEHWKQTRRDLSALSSIRDTAQILGGRDLPSAAIVFGYAGVESADAGFAGVLVKESVFVRGKPSSLTFGICTLI